MSWTLVHWYVSWTLLRELDTGRLLRDIDTGTELSVVSFAMMMKNKRDVSKANHVLIEASKRGCHKSITFSFWKDELLPFENNFDVNLVSWYPSTSQHYHLMFETKPSGSG
jgi:hypothetical protein